MKDKTNLYILGIVVIVSFIGIIVLVMNKSQSIKTGIDLTGYATAVKKECAVYCTDDFNCVHSATQGDKSCGTKVWSDIRKSKNCDPSSITGTFQYFKTSYCREYEYWYVFWGKDYIAALSD